MVERRRSRGNRGDRRFTIEPGSPIDSWLNFLAELIAKEILEEEGLLTDREKHGAKKAPARVATGRGRRKSWT